MLTDFVLHIVWFLLTPVAVIETDREGEGGSVFILKYLTFIASAVQTNIIISINIISSLAYLSDIVTDTNEKQKRNIDRINYLHHFKFYTTGFI